MSAATDIKETLCQYLKSEFWMSKMKFNTNKKSLTHHLQNDSSIYKHLNPGNKCIFLRMTGDNFKAACKQPTQQIFFFDIEYTGISKFTLWSNFKFHISRQRDKKKT